MQLLVFGAVAFFFFRFALQKGYFSWLKQPDYTLSIPIEWFQVLGAFALYFFLGLFFIPKILLPMMGSWLWTKGQVSAMSWLNVLNGALFLVCILPFSKRVWLRKGQQFKPKSDLLAMVGALILVLPLIFICTAFFDLLLQGVFHLHNLPDQQAVEWLKSTFEFPLYFFLTTITIIVWAPVLEEVLFRGLLQSFLRRHLGRVSAVFLSSFCFACFHFSPKQGWNNLSIIASLFPLALFLGFLYEKRGSLFASISLHATFNTLSLLNIYFFGQML
ncbi:MAG: CPBP family intramembrane metalloprotease [Chlamydiia bacterium]|nr:CPBP family intramembrane metalloprotease [Chlamydiia bacterium]